MTINNKKTTQPKPEPVAPKGSRPVVDTGTAIAIGAGIGVVFGVLINNIGVGIALGTGVGVAIGAALEEAEKRRDKPKD